MLRSDPVAALLILLAGLLAGCSYAPSQPVKVAAWRMNPVPADQVNLLLLGDWGNGSSAQKDVAESMARYASSAGLQFNAAVTAGDNIYLRLRHVEDPRFGRLFEDMYDPQRLAMPFYMTLGNHDYYFGIYKFQLAYPAAHPTSRWKQPDRFYRIDFPIQANPLVAVIVLDSNSGPLSDDEWKRQLGWMDEQLAKARREARWLICVAHHPFFSNGMHGDNLKLQREWGPLMRKHGVDLYVCGHDHDLQHLEIPGWPFGFLIVGGGGAGKRWLSRKYGPFSELLHGFGHLHATPDRLTARLINVNGQVVHEFHRTPQP